MSKEYYLIPKELIDSRIEELEKYIELTEKEIEQHESIEIYDRDENWEDKLNEFESNKDSQMGALVSLIRFKDLITQQSELVEVEENIDEYYKEMVQSNEAKDYNAWKFTKAKEGYFFCNFVKDYHENKGFKLIKTITK